jgi:hypothetical protein
MQLKLQDPEVQKMLDQVRCNVLVQGSRGSGVCIGNDGVLPPRPGSLAAGSLPQRD